MGLGSTDPHIRLGGNKISHEGLVAGRRRDAAKHKPEPRWTGDARIWDWTLRAALGLQWIARLRPVQYAAALVFALSSAGIFSAIAIAIIMGLGLTRGLTADQMPFPIETTVVGSGAAWLVVSPFAGVLRAVLKGNRRPESLLLSVIRFMGAPARESLRAWDGIFFHIDKKIGRVIATPLLWFLRKPRRVFVAAAVLIVGFLLTAYGLLLPGQTIVWANQFGRGLKFVGGSGAGFAIFLVLLFIIVWFTAMTAYLSLVGYVWLRSSLLALPFLAIYVMDKGTALHSPIWDPAISLITYLPPGIAEAYQQPAETWLADILLGLSRVFLGSPGAPTTAGLILGGILISWLPFLIERLDKPTARDVVVRYGWDEANNHARAVRARNVFVNALWGGSLATIFFAFSPFWFLSSPVEKTPFYLFLFVVIPAGSWALLLRLIAKITRKRGSAVRPRHLDMTVGGRTDGLGEPEKLPSIAENYSPLNRLLSEAQRRRSHNSAEEVVAR